MLDRREFLKAAGLAALAPTACVTTGKQGAWVNDIHSQLNRTWVSDVRKPAFDRGVACGDRDARGPVVHRRRPSRDGRPAVRAERHCSST